MTSSCALDGPEYKNDLRILINSRTTNCWIGAVNCHGVDATRYKLFTIWNITDTEVFVLYVNFQKHGRSSMTEFVRKTKHELKDLKVNLILTLQDGENKLVDTLFPLIHFAKHTIHYLQILDIICTYRNNGPVGVYSSDFFNIISKLYVHLNAKLQTIRDSSHSDNLLLQQPFTRDMLSFFEMKYNELRLTRTDLGADRTNEIAQAFLQLITLLQQRQNVLSPIVLTQSSRNIIEKINTLQYIFANQSYYRSLPGHNQHRIPTLLPLYKSIFQAHPLLPYEGLIFSPEYECAIVTKEAPHNRPDYYLLIRIKRGYRYMNNFSFWCGSTRRIVIYPTINIDAYASSLQLHFPKKYV